MALGRGPTGSSSSAAAPPSSSATRTATLAAQQQHSSWQSPVPYLFGGLAAMLGLIALSLLALACSYWKLSGSLSAGEEEDDDAHRQARRRAGDDGEKGAAAGKAGPAGDKWRDHVVVIMAGDERPTFLAMPASGRADDDGAASSSGGGGSEQGRCVECGVRARPAGLEDDELMSRGEQSAGSSGSVTSHGT
ncbi:hypothetical protein PR202_gb06397 [Eleusine coracana subsp. coracana]|uniref:GDU1 n=1 Tax=Eleusine coracana subsp. coracana TaxID=191504 RepID=A0AAV5E9K1_ELECO|nr:hypothetical protein PR202_gb06397 [Eleusine coracana subsp. coracana]